MEKIAVVRIRGRRKVRKEIEDTLRMLRLERPNHCVLVNNTPQYLGMLNKVKDYVAFGPVGKEVVFKLVYKRGRKGGKRVKEVMSKEEVEKVVSLLMEGKRPQEAGIRPVFRLRPPSGGYKNIKRPYPEGDLGKRDDMEKLLVRMI